VEVVYVILLLVILIVFVTFNVKYKKQYKDFFEPLDAKEYSYKSFLPGCLGLVEFIKLNGVGRYQARLSQKIVMVHGSRYAAYYNKVHWAAKTFHLFLGLIMGCVFCLLAQSDATGLAIIPALGMGLFFLADKNLDDQYKERKFKMERDFPDFVSKLILLVNAGLTVRQAIERIVADAPANAPLYKELHEVVKDIQAGSSENEAYSDFAERCKLKQITNFVSILQQNIRLGGNQMLYELRRMSTECWEMRKNTARQLGETASSKLMIPLVIMFLAVVLICIAPVILELRSVF
jgi:tight adherence protein C